MKNHNHSDSTDAHGSTNFKTLFDEIEEATGFSMKKELNALITEVFVSDKFDSDNKVDAQTTKSAAFIVGMQEISKYLYEKPMTELIGSDDAQKHTLGLHAMTVSFHKANMEHGRGHSGKQDPGSFELMHVLNPRKDTENVRDHFWDDYELTAEEGAKLREEIQSGKTVADIFGKMGGMSADGLLGQGFHTKGIMNLAEWAGVELGRYDAVNTKKMSVNFLNFDSNNVDGIFLGMGKRGNGRYTEDGEGRNKFEETLEYSDFAKRLDFVPGEASDRDDTASSPGPGGFTDEGKSDPETPDAEDGQESPTETGALLDDEDPPFEFYFVNTETDAVIGQVKNGETVSAADLDGPMSIFGTKIEGDDIEVTAVRLSYGNHERVELLEPYALFGNRGDDFWGGRTFEEGQHEIEVDLLDTDRKVIESFDFVFDIA
ncbi:hypothetical protein [uncultured Roseobacter sp.]|uniref:hypothetical protein n=1 Tax=uncultured Roseobacter sp. TaxID=114847 RepID=UPI0026249B78|nr:hypothetical protein [uncultured Roseobacter sp.]